MKRLKDHKREKRLCHWLKAENKAQGGTEKCPCPDDHMDERMPLIKICHKEKESV